MSQLDRQGIAEDTVVIFMTDNGSAAGFVQRGAAQGGPLGFNAGMRDMKGSQYEEGHRVPCFIRYARALPTNRDFDKLTAHIDLVPTLASLCDLKLDASLGLDGRNLVEFLDGQRPWQERTHIVQSHRVEVPVKYRKSVGLDRPLATCRRSGTVRYPSRPGQRSPLPAADHAATIASLRASYDAWWADMKVDPSQYSNIPLGTRLPRASD